MTTATEDYSIITDCELKDLKISFPVSQPGRELTYATLQLDDWVITGFASFITLQFDKPLAGPYGLSILAEFHHSVRKGFEVLLNRVAVMQMIDPKDIKNPIGENNKAYLKVGPKFVMPENLSFEADIKFGIYAKRGGKVGFFMRLE